MSRKANLASYYSTDELKQRYLKSQDPIESRRWHLIWKVSLGWSIKNSTIAIGINYEYGREIIKRYNELGEKGVENLKKIEKKHDRGRKQLLNGQQIEKLKHSLERRPADGGIWTGAKVARWIEVETGVEKVWNQRGWDYLKKFDYSWQRPRPKHYKVNKLEQEEFIEKLPLKVQILADKYPSEQIDVWCLVALSCLPSFGGEPAEREPLFTSGNPTSARRFFDEHRVGLKPILRKIWAKKGSRPIAVVNHRYEWLYIYGFVKPKTGETFWYLIPRVNPRWLNLVYANFARDAGTEGARILLIEDNAGWHRSKKAEIPEKIHIEYLPAYYPELQPAERLWSLVDEPLVNEYFETIDEIEEVLTVRCNTLIQMTEEIKNLTYYHWLSFL